MPTIDELNHAIEWVVTAGALVVVAMVGLGLLLAFVVVSVLLVRIAFDK